MAWRCVCARAHVMSMRDTRETLCSARCACVPHTHTHLCVCTAHSTVCPQPATLQAFEGLKAYLDSKGNVRLFRPDMNMKRLAKSMERLSMPALDEKGFLECIKQLVRLERYVDMLLHASSWGMHAHFYGKVYTRALAPALAHSHTRTHASLHTVTPFFLLVLRGSCLPPHGCCCAVSGSQRVRVSRCTCAPL